MCVFRFAGLLIRLKALAVGVFDCGLQKEQERKNGQETRGGTARPALLR